MLERIEIFIQTMQKDSIKLFQHRFVVCLIMMRLVKDLVVIKLVFDVLMKKMIAKLHKVEQQVSDRNRQCGVVMVT